MDGWLYEKVASIERGVAYLIQKLEEAENKSKKKKDKDEE